MFMAVFLVALLLQASQAAAPKPLFPIRVHATFSIDLNEPRFADYRQRLLKAAPASAQSPPVEFKLNSPLFPDPTREANAYGRLTFPPQLDVFFLRRPLDPKVPVEDQDRDLLVLLKNTASDPPVPAGEKPITRPPVDKTFSLSSDGILSLDIPAETLTRADYTNNVIASDRDLLGAQMTLRMSEGFELQTLSLEFAGKSIRLRPAHFTRSVGRRDVPVYTMRLTPEAFALLGAR